MQQQQRRRLSRLRQVKSLEERLSHVKSLEERLADEAKRLCEEAWLLPPGAVRELVLRKARQAKTSSHVSERSSAMAP